MYMSYFVHRKLSLFSTMKSFLWVNLFISLFLIFIAVLVINSEAAYENFGLSENPVSAPFQLPIKFSYQINHSPNSINDEYRFLRRNKTKKRNRRRKAKVPQMFKEETIIKPSAKVETGLVPKSAPNFGSWTNAVGPLLRSLSIDAAIRKLDVLKRGLINYYSQSDRISTARDGIAFPSLEGALLSLAFLTFAVFLIDLVQNLLSRVRVPANNMMMMQQQQLQSQQPVRGRSIFSIIVQEPQLLSTLTNLILSSIERPIFS